MEQQVERIGQCHKDARIEGRPQVDHELLRQSCVHQGDAKRLHTHQAVGDEVARTRRQYDGKQLVLQTESYSRSHYCHKESPDNHPSQLIEMIPEGHWRGLTFHLPISPTLHFFSRPSRDPSPRSYPP